MFPPRWPLLVSILLGPVTESRVPTLLPLRLSIQGTATLESSRRTHEPRPSHHSHPESLLSPFRTVARRHSLAGREGPQRHHRGTGRVPCRQLHGGSGGLWHGRDAPRGARRQGDPVPRLWHRGPREASLRHHPHSLHPGIAL